VVTAEAVANKAGIIACRMLLTWAQQLVLIGATDCLEIDGLDSVGWRFVSGDDGGMLAFHHGACPSH